jgi:hypothetical protein
MTENQKILIEELGNYCIEKQTYEFDFSIEMWGVLWMPWFVYINNENVKISVNNIENSDLTELTNLGLIEKVKEFDDSELDYPTEISRTKYRIKTNAQHTLQAIWVLGLI